MREIPLTRGYVALVDDEDYEALTRFKWHAVGASIGPIYAVRAVRTAGGIIRFRMHRQIMGEPAGVEVDHANGASLDNRRANLRVATRRQNSANRAGWSKSGFKGVFFDGRRDSWRASVKVGGRQRHLGYFLNPTVAARAYDDAARQYFGEFARLNFPDGSTLPGIDAVREGHASAEGHSR